MTGERIFSLYDQIDTKKTAAGIITKDADLLELAATAYEYRNQGHHGAYDWVINTKKRLRTNAAKEIIDALEQTDPASWRGKA